LSCQLPVAGGRNDETQATGNGPLATVVEQIAATIADNPPLTVREGNVIKPGVDPELDQLRSIARDSKSVLVEIETRERERSGIAILGVGGAVGEIDALASLATIAIRHRYVRPTLSDAAEICIEDGRHPVIEVIGAERFIPNHTDVARERNGIQIITGPNMG